jgi:hypothetical protein
MMNFLEKVYDMATEGQPLLAMYKVDPEKKKVAVNKSFAATVNSTDDSSDNNDTSENAREKARKKSEDFCGKCPLCSNHHTWVRMDGSKWPSDRFLSCRKFNDQIVAGH